MAFTFFFRDPRALGLISKHVVPKLAGKKDIKIWDAGCAHGPEPYSLAITLREEMSHFMFRNVKIYATDIDGSNLFENRIREGVYSRIEIGRIPDSIKKRYFSQIGETEHFKIKDELRSRVNFLKHDLLSLKPAGGDFNLIVCKNVLLHFTPSQRLEVLKMFYNSLASDGFLVLERTQEIPELFDNMFEKVSSGGQLFRKLKDTIKNNISFRNEISIN